MPSIVVAGPPVVRVTWSCARCGHTGGRAQTTFPLEPTGDVWPLMVGLLRRKLMTLHHQRQGCPALPDDFIIGRGVE